MINKGAETLPGKDAHTYKQLAKFYDAKNYKKGLKQAQKLLESHPQHPETLSLKALFLQALGQEAKALEIAKIGLMKSRMKSMFCWHTCGTIYKLGKDYAEAAKCFQNALRLDPDNIQLMRETACLHIQVRDHANHVAARLAVLKHKPGLIQNWVSFTLSHHLRGDFPSLFKALASLDNLIKTTDLKPTEKAHYYLYRVVAFRDAEDWQGMHRELKINHKQIKDEVMFYEYLYESSLHLGLKQEAAQALQVLLKKFPENNQYLKQYQSLNKLETRQAFIRVQEEFKSKIAKIYELCHVEDQSEFKKLFSQVIKPYYERNLISLYAEIQVIYESGKGRLIEEVFNQYHECLKNDTYPDGSEAVSPSEYLWSLYLLAQHHSRSFDTLPVALDYINQALKHTCTVTEFYMVKADIQYRLHHNLECLQTINQARKTDLADRYMNNICVKYLLKCQQTELGQQVVRMFMRDDASLYELQNHWYIIEAAKGFLKKGNFAAGLRHLQFINKQFQQFLSNEFDFHAYCCRRWTLREYTELIAFNDNIYDDKKYAQASGLAIRYLREWVHRLQEKKLKPQQEQEKKEDGEGKKKKKKKKKHVEEATEQSPIETFHKKMDYFGTEYAERVRKQPMQEALVYANNISSIKYTNKDNLSENKLFGRAFSQAIQVFIHFKKPLLVLRCLNKLRRTNYCPFSIHCTTLHSLQFFEEHLRDPKTSDIAKQFITEFMQSTLKGESFGQYNERIIKGWKQSVTQDQQYLIDIKAEEAKLILTDAELRHAYINLYLQRLIKISQAQKIQKQDTRMAFYLTHRLQFYGQFTEELKNDLHSKLKDYTTYFSTWREEIPKLPESTWTMWWLSDYDVERELQEIKEGKEKDAETVVEAKKAET